MKRTRYRPLQSSSSKHRVSASDTYWSDDFVSPTTVYYFFPFVFYESLSTGRKKFYLSRAGKKLSFIDSFTIAQRYDSIPVRNNSAIIETTRGEKKPPIFVIYLESTFHRIPQKKKNHTSRKNHAKQCLRSYEIRFVFVEPGRIYSRKFVPFEHGSYTMELHLSHVHSLKRNFTRPVDGNRPIV